MPRSHELAWALIDSDEFDFGRCPLQDDAVRIQERTETSYAFFKSYAGAGEH